MTAFLLIMNQMRFFLVHNDKENCHQYYEPRTSYLSQKLLERKIPCYQFFRVINRMDQTNFFLNRYEKFRFLFLPCYLYTVHLHEFHFRKFVQFNMWYKQRDLYFEYCNIKLNLDCNYTFPIDLTRFEIECSLCTGKSLIGYPWCRGTSVSWTAVHLIDAVFASLAWTESMRKADPTIRWICKKCL